MSDPWIPPDGVVRVSPLIKVSIGMFKGGEYRCPAADALKARSYCLVPAVRQPQEKLEQFAFGPFMAACDARSGKAGGPAVQNSPGRPGHDGLKQWTAHALSTYAAAFPEDPDFPMAEVSTPWCYSHAVTEADSRGASEYQLTVWGRCLQSTDGSVRELRLPVNRLAELSPPAGFAAAAALVLAEGAPGPRPQRVRIVEFALLDGRTRTVFEGSRDEALAFYRLHGRTALAELLDGRQYRPGAVCASCPYTAACPVLRRAPGLLEADRPGRTRRWWSVTNGRNHRACPARDQMRRLHLPAEDGIDRSAAAERGRALHAYLAARHEGSRPRPCTAKVPEQWVPEGFHLPEQERALGVALLRGHAAVCPMRLVRDASDVHSEPRVVRYDTEAEVVVVARPDLLYRDDGVWVWRETKSTTWDRGVRSLLEHYPQLALAVLLLAREDLGGRPGGARIELEVLRPGGADLELVDPFDPAIRAEAGRVVKDLVDPWIGDEDYPPSPGTACNRCETARWCSSGPAFPVAR